MTRQHELDVEQHIVYVQESLKTERHDTTEMELTKRAANKDVEKTKRHLSTESFRLSISQQETARVQAQTAAQIEIADCNVEIVRLLTAAKIEVARIQQAAQIEIAARNVEIVRLATAAEIEVA